jgi:hypothetical protein
VEGVKYGTSEEQTQALNSQYAQLPPPDPYVYDDSDAEDVEEQPDTRTRYPTPRSMPELPSVSQLPQPVGEDNNAFEQPDGMNTQPVNQRYEDEFQHETDEDTEFQDFEGDSLEVGGNTLLEDQSTVDQSMPSTVNCPSLLPRSGSPSPLGDYPDLNLVHHHDPQKFAKVFCFAMYKAIDSSDRFSESEPRNFKEAMRSVDAPHWKTAFDLEVNTCIKTGTWIIKRLPPGAICLPGT